MHIPRIPLLNLKDYFKRLPRKVKKRNKGLRNPKKKRNTSLITPSLNTRLHSILFDKINIRAGIFNK